MSGLLPACLFHSLPTEHSETQPDTWHKEGSNHNDIKEIILTGLLKTKYKLVWFERVSSYWAVLYTCCAHLHFTLPPLHHLHLLKTSQKVSTERLIENLETSLNVTETKGSCYICLSYSLRDIQNQNTATCPYSVTCFLCTHMHRCFVFYHSLYEFTNSGCSYAYSCCHCI